MDCQVRIKKNTQLREPLFSGYSNEHNSYFIPAGPHRLSGREEPMGEKQKNQDQVKKFWDKKEEALGGHVVFQTYVTYLGDAGTGVYNGRGGLFYVINDRLYFEDFEKFNALMALFNRKDEDYEKTEFSIPLEDVSEMCKVTEKDAKACIDGQIEEDKVPEMSKFKSFFNRGYWKMVSRGRPTMFIEIMDEDGLFKFLPHLK